MLAHFANDPDMEHGIWTAQLSACILPPLVLKNDTADEQALGRSRGRFSTKFHALVDGLGNPLRLLLTDGQRHDSPHTSALLMGLTFDHVIADRGYPGPTVTNVVQASGA
jgi:hypothetical protein